MKQFIPYPLYMVHCPFVHSLSLCTFIVALTLMTACHRPAKVVSAETEAIAVNSDADSIQDSTYLAVLAPVKEGMEREMSVVIGYAAEDMYVAAPECPMLNWASDALWKEAQQVYDGQVDIAIVNMGGMRCSWKAGPITKGNVFELMPFDNQLVVLTLKGSDIEALCESFVRYGGQGVAGLRMTAVDGRLGEVQIGNRALDPEATYHVATSDYLAGGADHMDALKNYTDCWNSNLLIRDLYLHAVAQDTIRATVDGRMRIL